MKNTKSAIIYLQTKLIYSKQIINLLQYLADELKYTLKNYYFCNAIKVKSILIQEINKAIKVLKGGGLILYPTDTVWGIGCDATNEEAVQKIYKLKQRTNSKALICLVANDFMLENHVTKVPEVAFDLIDLATRPMTIIYDQPKGVAKNLIADDNTLGIRVATDQFCQYLINKFKRPVVSTSANVSGEPTPKSFSEISDHILEGVDYVVNLNQENTNNLPSTIIKLGNDGTVKVIRK